MSKNVTLRLPQPDYSTTKLPSSKEEGCSTAFKVGIVVLSLITAAALAGIVCKAVGVLPSYFPAYSGWIAAGTFALTASTLLALVLNRAGPTEKLKKTSASSCAKDVAHVALFVISATALATVALSSSHLLPHSLPAHFNWMAAATFMISSSLLLIMHLKDVTKEKVVVKAPKKVIEDLTTKGKIAKSLASHLQPKPEPQTEADAKKALKGETDKPKYYRNWLEAYYLPRGVAPPKHKTEAPKEAPLPPPNDLGLPTDIMSMIGDCLTPEDRTVPFIDPALDDEMRWWNRCMKGGVKSLELNNAAPTYKELYISHFGAFIHGERSALSLKEKSAHGHKPRQVATSSDGNSLIVLSDYTYVNGPPAQDCHAKDQSSTLYIWNLKTNKCQLLQAELHEAHKDVILHFDVKGPFIATCSRDKTLKIWDSKTLKLLGTYSHRETPRRVALLKDNRIVFGDNTGNLTILQIQKDGTLSSLQDIPTAFTGVAAQLMVTDRGFFVAGNQDLRIKYYEEESPNPTKENPTPSLTWVCRGELDKHQAPLTAAVYQSRQGRVTTLKQKDLIGRDKYCTEHTQLVEQVEKLDEHLLVTADRDGFLYVWDLSNPRTPQPKLKLKFDTYVTSLHLKGYTLACGTKRGEIFVLNLKLDYNLEDPFSNFSRSLLDFVLPDTNKELGGHIYSHPDSEERTTSRIPIYNTPSECSISTLLLRGRSLFVGSPAEKNLQEFQFVPR